MITRKKAHTVERVAIVAAFAPVAVPVVVHAIVSFAGPLVGVLGGAVLVTSSVAVVHGIANFYRRRKALNHGGAAKHTSLKRRVDHT
jgi:hypothetical protein